MPTRAPTSLDCRLTFSLAWAYCVYRKFHMPTRAVDPRVETTPFALAWAWHLYEARSQVGPPAGRPFFSCFLRGACCVCITRSTRAAREPQGSEAVGVLCRG